MKIVSRTYYIHVHVVTADAMCTDILDSANYLTKKQFHEIAVHESND